MKKDILERYETTLDGEIIVDISAQKVEDLYNNFDKKSHFMKKDLNQDLVAYLIESVKEIDGERFVIRFNFEIQPPEEFLERIKNSVKRFFLYLREHEHAKMQEMLRKSSIFFIIGAVLAGISIFMNQSALMQTSITFAVVAEGSTVAAWVSLWEALATFLIRWMPYKKKILLYKNIANATILFETEG